jgi:IS4 transposase
MHTENGIGKGGVSLEEICRKLEETTLNSVRKVLPDRAIHEACAAAGHVYRECLLTPLVTVLHMILSAIWPEDSFRAGWQVLWDSMVSRLPDAAGRSPTDSSVTKARGRLPVALWEKLLAWVSQRAQELSSCWDTWRGHRVVLLDGTCVSMPDEPELFATFGRCRTRHGEGRYPVARLVTLALANTMTVLAYAIGAYREDETALSLPLLGMLKPGDLVVADRHHAGANLYYRYLSRGLEFLTRVHQNLKVSRLRRLETYARGDFLAEMKIDRAYRKKDPALPAMVIVRLIQVVIRSRGKREVTWLVTSLLDPKRYPAQEIAELYARRWRIETLFREVKINLSADVLRSKTAHGIRKEIIARLVALNIVRMIILEAAREHRIDPLRISFVHATRAILTFAPALATEPIWKLPSIYQAMLQEIASQIVPQRPGRNEPRAVRRDPKSYPRLRETRRAWRLRNVA